MCGRAKDAADLELLGARALAQPALTQCLKAARRHLEDLAGADGALGSPRCVDRVRAAESGVEDGGRGRCERWRTGGALDKDAVEGQAAGWDSLHCSILHQGAPVERGRKCGRELRL